jgi:hypothetical protein
MEFPVIFQYLDPIQYLRDYYAALQEVDPNLTVRRWSEQMGFSSPFLLVSILRRRKLLRLKDLNFIKRGLDLEPSQMRFMEVLILLARSTGDEEKQVFEFLLALLVKCKSLNILS